jgi:hypothetical protein
MIFRNHFPYYSCRRRREIPAFFHDVFLLKFELPLLGPEIAADQFPAV